ncbi:hypothetical protein HN011_006912 [Eciton burchellii]|nr:hypothetical protein HN011_006912 [Eciton burchellii]
MRISCFILAFATIFVVLIVHAPNVQAKAVSDGYADANADANADALADPFADPGIFSFFKMLGRLFLKLFKKVGPTIATEAAIRGAEMLAPQSEEKAN